jgi:DNA-binding LacI/PurR family transcriptional regulator
MAQGQPLYSEVRDSLLEDIQAGRYEAGEQLPSMGDLEQDYDVSSITIRRALQELEAEGWVDRRQGVGTFVRAQSGNKSIIAILGDLHQGIGEELMPAMDAAARQHGADVMIRVHHEDGRRLQSIIEDTHLQSFDGFLVEPVSCGDTHINLDVVNELRRAQQPFVLLDSYIDHVQCDYVVSDNFEGGTRLTSHILENGCRRVGFITDSFGSSVRERLLGYKKAHAEAGLPVDEELIYRASKRTTPAGREGLQVLMELEEPPDAVFAIHSGVALGVLAEARERDLAIPDDLALGTYDDLDFVSHLSPPLTVIRQPLEEMGRKAVAVLLKRMEEPAGPVQHLVLESELLVRRSTSRAGRPAGERAGEGVQQESSGCKGEGR